MNKSRDGGQEIKVPYSNALGMTKSKLLGTTMKELKANSRRKKGTELKTTVKETIKEKFLPICISMCLIL